MSEILKNYLREREACITDTSEGMSEGADIRIISRSGKRHRNTLGLESKISSQYIISNIPVYNY